MNVNIVAVPSAEDVRKARKQATEAVTGVLDQARTPLYAALGAGNAAIDYAKKARAEAGERTLAGSAQVKVNELSARLTELRGKVERRELRELADHYRGSLNHVYEVLTARGEKTFDELASRTRGTVDELASRTRGTVDELASRTRGTVDDLANRTKGTVDKLRSRPQVAKAKTLADDVLGKVSSRVPTGNAKATTAKATTAKPATDKATASKTTAGKPAARRTTRKS